MFVALTALFVFACGGTQGNQDQDPGQPIVIEDPREGTAVEVGAENEDYFL